MDYQLRFVDRGGAHISNKEYCAWRSNGNAFEFDETAVLPENGKCSLLTDPNSKSNQSHLSAFTKVNQSKTCSRQLHQIQNLTSLTNLTQYNKNLKGSHISQILQLSVTL